MWEITWREEEERADEGGDCNKSDIWMEIL